MAGKRTSPRPRPIELYVKVTLTRVPSGFPPVSCQVAIDTDGNGALSDGEFVNLIQSSMTWSGVYSYQGNPLGKRVMVGLLGCIHAKYSIEVRRDTNDGPKLVDDSGTVSKDPDGFILWMESMS
jgi:hypothetical protein